MENKDVVVFVLSYNKLGYLEKLIAWLEKAGFRKIFIVDNASTYSPLVEYLQASSHTVYRLEKNYGHLAVWECGLFDDMLRVHPYIVTDPDILPIEECPGEVTHHFWRILSDHPEVTKVGFSLKIDDIPDTYSLKKNVIEWEKQFWKKSIGDGLYDASIDTTFALYRPGIYPNDKRWWRSIRTGFPFIARHLPWYENSLLPKSEEDVYYEKHLKEKSSFWSVTDGNLLKEYNTKFIGELSGLYAMRRWKILSFVYRVIFLLTWKKRFLEKAKTKRFLLESIDVTDVAEAQKRNVDIASVVFSIQNSGGWKFLERIGL